MNRGGFSIIEVIVSAAVLAISCAYICSMSSFSNRLTVHCMRKYGNVCHAQAIMERAKGTAFELIESSGPLTVSEIDSNTKELSVNVEGFRTDAIRAKFD